MPADERQRADGVFEGGGVKGIAFAGAIAAAEKDAGVKEWVNVAGTSAGSIVAALLVAGYDAAGLQQILAKAQYPRYADCGPGGTWLGGVWNAIFRLRGLAPGNYFKQWLREQLAASPLAQQLGKRELTFADVKRTDLPPREQLPDVSDADYERASYRLHVIASDVTSGRMLILPEDLPDYQDAQGRPLEKDSYPLVDAVRMSMSFPFLFAPVVLHRDGKPVYVIDGGLLSNFPIWLFDSPQPKRPTWGFRLHAGDEQKEELPYRTIPRPLWEVPLLKAMFSAAMEAWDREQLKQAVSSRTVSIPTHQIATTDFGLSETDANNLYQWGLDSAHAFFTDPAQEQYLNLFGQTITRTKTTHVQENEMSKSASSHGSRFDPYKNFRFLVYFAQTTSPVAGFTKMSALDRPPGPIEPRQGEGIVARKGAGRTSYEAVTLERGLTHDSDFEQWANAAQQLGRGTPSQTPDLERTLMIVQLNEQGQPQHRWNLHRCWVTEFQAMPDLDAGANAVAIEHLKLQLASWEDASTTDATAPTS